jgi:hypothetical protein
VFIAQLSLDSVHGANLYQYCGNNSANGYDPTGYWTKKIHQGMVSSMVRQGPTSNYLRLIFNRYGIKYDSPYSGLGMIAGGGLVAGSDAPDIYRNKADKYGRKYSHWEGWHGVYNNAASINSALNSRLKACYRDADALLKAIKSKKLTGAKAEYNVRKAFYILGTAMHAIQDSFAHFAPQHPECDKIDYIYDFKTNEWKTIDGIVTDQNARNFSYYANPRAAASIKMCQDYLFKFTSSAYANVSFSYNYTFVKNQILKY